MFGLPQQEKKNWKLLHLAQGKTQINVKNAENVYEDQMRVVGAKMEKELERITIVAQQEFGRFLAIRSSQTDELVDDAMLAFTKRLEEKLTTIEDRILKFSQEEKMRVRLEAENYRTKMMDMTKEDIVKVLGEVEKILLGKKITPEIQADLVSEALEKAKKDDFIS